MGNNALKDLINPVFVVCHRGDWAVTSSQCLKLRYNINIQTTRGLTPYTGDLQVGLRGQEASAIRNHEWLGLTFCHSCSSLTDFVHMLRQVTILKYLKVL